MVQSTIVTFLIILATVAGTAMADGPMRLVSIWNQAYQENYEEDKVSEIVTSAHNSYVLLDPFKSVEARKAISQIKKNGNTVSIYLSIGTGENWRDDFPQIKPFLVTKQWGDWEGEYFIDRVTEELVSIMQKRIDQAA